ncbi:MAG: COR domain-containing protein, partial [Bacteroidota bacterium]
FILNNTWATDAVYKVLDNEDIKNQYGYFTQADLEKIWSNRRYRSKRPQLLALMENFQLCFALKDRKEKTWLAPQLLPVEAPPYEWNEQQNLEIRYRYAFMPKGLLSRFFVRMNRYVHDLDKAWKSGVFLQREHTDAFVRETYGSKEIVVKVRGAHPKELMTLIAEEFDKMNGSYGEKLRVEKFIPCACKVCKNNSKPHFFRYKNLKSRKEAGKQTIECDRKPFEDVSVLGLLSDVFVEEVKKTAQDLEVNTSRGLKTIELFLASSSELEAERRAIEIWLGRENKQWVKKGIFFHLNIWEDFLDSISITRKQDDYNEKVLRSDIFISLFGTKVGKYTEEEFDTAFGSFLDGGKPKYIYTFFQEAEMNITKIDEVQFLNYKRFEKEIRKAGHFTNYFKTTEGLILQLKQQLDKILEEMR